MTILNRVVKWTRPGDREYCIDQRHSHKPSQGLCIETSMEVTSPITRQIENLKDEEKNKQMRTRPQSTNTTVTRTTDKEAEQCNVHTAPQQRNATTSEWAKPAFKTPTKRQNGITCKRRQRTPRARMAKFMNGAAGMMVRLFGWEYEDHRVITVYTDANWCKQQGDAPKHAREHDYERPHLSQSWSSTQRAVALSSDESELHACNRGGMEALGNTKIDAKATMEAMIDA